MPLGLGYQPPVMATTPPQTPLQGPPSTDQALLAQILQQGQSQPPKQPQSPGVFGGAGSPPIGTLSSMGGGAAGDGAGTAADVGGGADSFGGLGSYTGTSAGAAGGAGSGSGGVAGMGPVAGPALFAALIGSGKIIEHNNANNPLGQGLLAGLGPSFSQVKKDPVGMGLPTLLGAPFLTPFTSSRAAQDTKPEWQKFL